MLESETTTPLPFFLFLATRLRYCFNLVILRYDLTQCHDAWSCHHMVLGGVGGGVRKVGPVFSPQAKTLINQYKPIG